MAVIGLAVGLPVLLTTLFHWNLIIVAVVQGVLAIGLGLFAGVAKSTHRSRQAPSNTAGDHRPPSALNRFVGTARNVRRTDLQPSSTSLAFVQGGQSLRRTMLSFRLEVTDEQGDIGFYRQVELVGDVIHGDIADGDQVEISSWTERQGVLAVTRVRNLSLNGDVSVEQNTGIQWFSRARLAVGVVGFIAFACFFYFVSSQLTSMKPPPGFGMPPVTTPPGVTTLPGAMNNAINHPNLPPPVVHR